MKKSSTANDELIAFVDRRHPAYQRMLSHWAFLDAAYRGGRDWFAGNIFRYMKEGDNEFADRLNRAYRFNHTREVVELVQKYLFKAPASRRSDDAPDAVKNFWRRATFSGGDIDQLMRTVSTKASITGRVALVVDNNYPAEVDENGNPRKISVAEAKLKKYRIYAYVVPQVDILDYAFDEDGDGELLWIKLREFTRDDADPLRSSGDVLERTRLWTREGWALYEKTIETSGSLKKATVREIRSGTHDLGFVPVRLVDHVLGNTGYEAPGLIDDIAYLDRAVANYLSNLDAIIQDQTFSQLAIPAQALQPGDDMFSKVVTMGTKRIFVYDSGQGSTAKPEYLSPDPKQAGVILSVINKIINEIYHTIGLAGERTKQDNAVGIDNSSGVAKAYDFERVNSLLLSKAKSCETAENWLVSTVLAWAGEDGLEDDLVTYPTTFDVTSLTDDLVMAESLAKIEAPIEVRREQMRGFVERLFPQLSADLRAKLRKDIETWLDGADLLAPPTSFGGKPVAAPSRQGEVTRDTPSKDSGK